MSSTVRRTVSRARAAGALCVIGSLILFAAVAGGQTVRAGNLIVTVEGGFTPHRLPMREPASITLSARSTIRTADGTHLPALDYLKLEFDRHTGVNIKGLPFCTIGRLRNTITKQAKKSCRKAIIGSGQAGAEIAFPEQEPFFARAPMVIFNGPPKHGHPVFIFHVHAHVPAPTTFITTAEIGRAKGLYGTSVYIKVPTIVHGQGSLSFAELSIHKKWRQGKRRQTLLYGTCPSGHFYVRGALTFKGGFKMAGKVVRSCSPIRQG
jgi:hypothetical protein